MKTVVLGDPPEVLISLISERQRLGLDTHDEVWQGDYHMAPAANFQHGRVGAELVGLFQAPARVAGLTVSLEFNVGDPQNFRVPDLGVHRGQPSGVWIDSAAIVVEVRSPDDETYDKFDFYFERGIEEVLVTDLATKVVTWFVRGDSAFVHNDRSEILGLTTADVAAALDW